MNLKSSHFYFWDDMSHAEEISRGEHAKRILDDELVKSAFADIEATIIGQWCELSVENKTQAEELKRLLWAANQFKAIFEVTIAGAAVAKNELLNAETMQIRAEAARERVRNYV
jgi:hypothetical protein